jgi:hypothetical protein
MRREFLRLEDQWFSWTTISFACLISRRPGGQQVGGSLYFGRGVADGHEANGKRKMSIFVL